MYVNQTNLTVGTYEYQVFSADVPTSSSATDKRWIHIFDPYILSYNPSIDIDMAALDNTTIVVAWIDQNDTAAKYEVWDTNGTRILEQVELDTDGTSFSRIAVTPIDGEEFAIGVVDGSPEADVDFYIYNIYGSEVVGATEIDNNIGVNSDIALTQLGDRFVVCNANDADNDADFEIWSNGGSNIVPESNVDGNMDPGTSGQNLVDCVSIGNNNWMYAWFDDQANDITLSARMNNGSIYQTQDVDNNVGETGQVAAAGLRNGRVGVIYYDSGLDNIQIAVRALSGAAITPILANTVIAESIGGSTRVSAAEIENSGESYFVVAWEDTANSAITAAVYDSSGTEYTAPFNISFENNPAFRLIDVVGYVSAIDRGLCDESFVLAYSNSTNKTIFESYKIDGSSWNGRCELDTTPPSINLSTPADGENFSLSNVTFNWSATDNEAENITCSLIVDGVLRLSNINVENASSTQHMIDIANGNHLWNVTCTDTESNSNTSETRIFNVNIASRYNNISLENLGDFGTAIYTDTTNAGIPLQRNWTGVLGEEEILAPNLGSTISWQKFICSKINPECYLVAQQTDNSIDFVVFDLVSRTWHNQTVLASNRGLDNQRSFDIACEDDGVSEECLVMFEWTTATDAEIGYRVWNGTGLEDQQNYTVTGAPGSDFRWVSLFPQKGSNIIAAALQNDDSTRDQYALIWNGENNSIISEQLLTDSGSGQNRRQQDCAWEGNSGELLCAFGLNTDDLYGYEYEPGTNSWTYLGNIYSALNAQARELTLCGETPYTDEFTHDYIGVMTCDQDADRDGGVWNGSSFSKSNVGDQPAQDTSSECGGNENNIELRSHDCSFSKDGERIVYVWVDANENFPETGYYDISSSSWSFDSWGSGVPVGNDGVDDVEEVVLIPSPSSNEMFLIDQDVAEDMSCAIWTGRAFDITNCGDFENDGPSAAVGAYVSYDWLRFQSEPLIEFISPTTDTRYYNFSGITNISTNHIAFTNESLNNPPTAAESPMRGVETNQEGYSNLSTSDDLKFSSTISTSTGEHIVQSFMFEIGQSPNDINELKIFHEGYAAATTFINPDIYYIYVYNYTADNYTLLRTINNIYGGDIFTEITLNNNFNYSDIIFNGELYVLIEGDHATGFGGNARADLYTDYIDVIVKATPNIKGVYDVNISAIDQNGVTYCVYNLQNNSGDVSGNISTDKIASTLFINSTNTFAYGNGYYSFDATCKEYFGVQNNRTQNVYIDNTAPNTYLVSPNMSEYFTTENITFVWNATDNSQGVLNCDIFIDGFLNLSNNFVNSMNETNETIYDFNDGVHTWSITCYDVAGNSNTSETRNFTVDAGAPTVTLNYPDNPSLFNYNNILFNYTPSDALGISNCTIIFNGIANETNNTIINDAVNEFNVSGLIDANYLWSVNCSDLTGIVGVSEERNLTIDTTPPSVYLNTTDDITFTEGDAVLNFTFTDYLSDNGTCNITINGIVEDSDIFVTNSSTISRNITLPDGVKYWNVTCTDLAGNINTSETRNFTLEGPPYIELLYPWDEFQTLGNDLEFNYSIQDGDGIDNCSLYLNGAINETDIGGDLDNPGNNTFSITNLPVGTYIWYIECYDSLFNQGLSENRTLYVDDEAPTIDLIYPETAASLFDSIVDFNFTTEDNYAANMTCNLTIDGVVNPANQEFIAYNGTVTSVNQTLNNGDHYWNVTCMDLAGNIFTSSTRLVSIVAPLNVSVYIDPHEYQEGVTVQPNVTTTNITGGQVNSTTTTDYIFGNLSTTSAPWWDLDWINRIPINIQEIQGVDRNDELILANLTGLFGGISSCTNELRLLEFINHNNSEIPFNVVGGDDSTYCELEFVVNLSAGEQINDKYFAYYNNSVASASTLSLNYKPTKVQRDIVVGTGTTVVDTIDAVDTSKAFILFTANTGSTAPDRMQMTPDFGTPSILTFNRYDGTTESDISWQVIENKDLYVQRDNYSLTANEREVNVTINSVELNNSFIIVY